MPPSPVADILDELGAPRYSALDLLAEGSVEESLVALVLGERAQSASPALRAQFGRFREQVERTDTSGVKVLVFGGGTGLATIVGGDSRREDWPERPFTGLKQTFADLHSVVCVTDDGGSTGELRKTLPLVGLGDLRHVLLAAIRRDALIRSYGLGESGAAGLALALHGLFNHRFDKRPESAETLLAAAGTRPQALPGPMRERFHGWLSSLFTDPRLRPTLDFPQCTGNLLLAAAIFARLNPEDGERPEAIHAATVGGLSDLARVLGLEDDAVLPAALAPAELALLYSNGVLVTSEDKSASVRRGYPVDRVLTAFCEPPDPHPELPDLIARADVILFAPGSLYTSIIPILQTPGIAKAIRANRRALKLLVANIWVQSGETDASRDAPERKFYVSDLIRAWRRNIPGGLAELFSHVIALNMADIPSSVLQSYALEGKEPIFIDRERVHSLGFGLIEAAVFSRDLLARQGRLQHDPEALAKTIKTLWLLRCLGLMRDMEPAPESLPEPSASEGLSAQPATFRLLPCRRYAALCERLEALDWGRIDTAAAAEAETPTPLSARERRVLMEKIKKVLWRHPDIAPKHLTAPQSFLLVDADLWKQTQEWDNITSSYQPEARRILVRADLPDRPERFETALLVALGQSILGNYVAEKGMEPLLYRGNPVGLLYRLRLRPEPELDSLLSHADLGRYLELTRMRPCSSDPAVYTRAVNRGEGFTPPGLFFGLFYAWYLDNALAPNIEYKMAIMRHGKSVMIPEQMSMSRRRGETIDFFREKVFGAS